MLRFDNLRIPVSESQRIKGITPYYGANGIQDYVEGFTHDGEFILIAEDGANDIKNYPVQYVNGKIWVNNHAHVLKAKDSNSTLFMKYRLNSLDMTPYLSGCGRYKLNAEVLMKINSFVPSSEEQIKIADFLSLLDERIITQNKIIEDLISLKNELKEELSKSGETHVKIGDILIEVLNKSTIQNQFPVLSSTVKGVFLQSEYFERQVASENNIGYKIVERGNIIISPQNLWMGNMTFNDKFESGLVSPSYKIYKIKPCYDADLVFYKLTTRRSFYNYLLVSEQGASIVRRNLNIDAFEQLVIPFNGVKDAKILRALKSVSIKLENETAILKRYMLQKEYLLENLFI